MKLFITYAYEYIPFGCFNSSMRIQTCTIDLAGKYNTTEELIEDLTKLIKESIETKNEITIIGISDITNLVQVGGK